MAEKVTTRVRPARSAIVRLSDGIEIVLDRFLIPLTMGGLAVVVFFQVINRFILHISAAWTEEIGRYLFVWASLLGAVSGIRKMAHLNVEFVQNALGIKFKYILMIVSDILSLLFFWVLAHKGMFWAKTSGFRVLADSVDVPMFYIQVIVPVCAILMMIFTAEHMYCTISKYKETGD